MRVLCVLQSQQTGLEAIAEFLAKQHTVLLATHPQRQALSFSDIRRVFLRKPSSTIIEKNYLGFWNLVLRKAFCASFTYKSLRDEGFEPDLILASASDGIAFPLAEIFPASFLVSYADVKLQNLKQGDSGVYAARTMAQCFQFCNSQMRFIHSPTQLTDLQLLKDNGFNILTPYVDVDFYVPMPFDEYDKGFITFIGGSLSYSELQDTIRLVDALLKGKRTQRVAVLAENSLRSPLLKSFRDSLDEKIKDKFILEYSTNPEAWRSILSKSLLVVCLGADMGIMLPVLQAMSCGKLLLAKASSLSIFHPGENMLAFDGAKGMEILYSIENALNLMKQDKLKSIFLQAREFVIKEHNQIDILPRHIEHILDAYHNWKLKIGN